jgi:hypothetical protein
VAGGIVAIADEDLGRVHRVPPEIRFDNVFLVRSTKSCLGIFYPNKISDGVEPDGIIEAPLIILIIRRMRDQ